MCVRFGKNPAYVQDPRSTLRFGANVPAIACGLHLGLQKITKIFRRLAMNRSFSRTQDLMQSVQRQVKNSDRSKRLMQPANLAGFRWSRITLLRSPAAKLIRMKVHVLSDSTLCVGVSNPDPSNNWTTKLEDVGNEHGFVEQMNVAAREVRFI